MFETIVSNPFYAYLFIFSARVIDVSLGVFRLLMLTRGFALHAALIGFVEIVIFVVALGTVLHGGLDDPVKIVAYAAGFATGNLVGARIEEKMALGFVVVQIFPAKPCCADLITLLRENNYGVTTIAGEGRTGPRDILVVTAKRKDLPAIIRMLDEVAPQTFFNVSDIRSIHGGVFPRRKP